MQYVIILILKVLMMLLYFITQFFHLVFTFRFKGISPKEVWFDGWKKYRYDLFIGPTPRDMMWGFFSDYSDFFLDKQTVNDKSRILRHFV